MATEVHSIAKHGLSAGFRVPSNENQQEFDELIGEYQRAFSPNDTHERFLVGEMAQARWRLSRFRRVEAALIDQMIGAAELPASDAALLGNAADPFKVLQRYIAAAERSYYRALKELQAIRKLQAQSEEKADLPDEPGVQRPRNRESTVTSPATSEVGQDFILRAVCNRARRR